MSVGPSQRDRQYADTVQSSAMFWALFTKLSRITRYRRWDNRGWVEWALES